MDWLDILALVRGAIKKDDAVLRTARQVVAAVAARNARTALRSGITTLRDCGGFPDVLFALRQATQLGSELGPRLVLEGSPMTVKHGHCYYFGGEASGVNELRSKVRECITLGADYVKIMGSGGGTPGTISWMPSFNQDEMLALVEETHREHRNAIVHSFCAESIEYVITAGANEIEHANFLTGPDVPQAFDPHVAEKMAGKRVPVYLTLSVGRFVPSEGGREAMADDAGREPSKCCRNA